MEELEILCRWTGKVLYKAAAESIKHLLEKAVKDGANLYGANLDGANLYGANLDGANLYGANLSRATLYGANLYGATLYGATLYGANLDGANLYGATLYGANLSRANLYGANLYGATLNGANLDGATLNGANLDGCSLQPVSVYQWVQKNTYAQRTIGNRVMCIGKRDLVGQNIQYEYKPNTLYKAPFFSRCPNTECHPGLYIGSENWDFSSKTIYVAFWMDELIVTATDADKGRVPRFYTLTSDLGSSVGEFEGLDEVVMDGEAVVVERKKEE